MSRSRIISYIVTLIFVLVTYLVYQKLTETDRVVREATEAVMEACIIEPGKGTPDKFSLLSRSKKLLGVLAEDAEYASNKEQTASELSKFLKSALETQQLREMFFTGMSATREFDLKIDYSNARRKGGDILSTWDLSAKLKTIGGNADVKSRADIVMSKDENGDWKVTKITEK